LLSPDAPNFFESSFWKDSDPESGLGGWGDPDADYSVSEGGFRNFRLSYPSPHILRRNFTLQPFANLKIPQEIAMFFPHPLVQGNSSFSATEIEELLETPAGDFRTFQTMLEGFQVSLLCVRK